MNRGEAETGSEPGGFGREERFENAGQRCVSMPTPVVRDTQRRVGTDGKLGGPRRRIGAEVDGSSRDAHFAAVRLCVARVEDQVEQHELKPRGIGPRAHDVARLVHDDADVRRRARQDGSEPSTTSFRSTTCSWAGCCRPKASSDCVSSVARRTACCASANPSARARAVLCPRGDGVEGEAHDEEQVVEVVRNAASEMPSASIFCACRSCSSSFRCSVMS